MTPRHKRKNALALVIAAAVVAGTALAAAALRTRVREAPVGASTLEELANQGIAAVVEGDGGAYARLAPNWRAMTTCKYASDLDLLAEAEAADVKRMVRRSAGAKLRVKSVEPDADARPTYVKKGQHWPGTSCIAKDDFTVSPYAVKMEDGSDREQVQMFVIPWRDRYYLAGLPGLPNQKEDDEQEEDARRQQEDARAAQARRRLRGEGPSTPDGMARYVLEAAFAKSKDRALAVQVDESELGKVLSCNEDTSEKVRSAARVFASIAERVTNAFGTEAVIETDAVAVTSTKLVGTKSATEAYGCTATRSTEWAEVDVVLAAAADGSSGTSGLIMVKLDGTWRSLYRTSDP
ncbi:MAG: hypothetical protein U0838_18020 [Chloroflexota bacterium]